VAVSRRLWIVPAAALALAVVLVIALTQGTGGSGRADQPARALSATASLSARAVSFGDPFTARLDVVVDPRSVDPRTVEVQPRFGLYRVAGTDLKTVHGANSELLSYRFALDCLLPGCTPAGPLVTRRFQPVTISYRTRDGVTLSGQVRWPAFHVASRVTAAERRRPVESLRFDASLPAPTYRVAPRTLRALATGLAALLALVAALLAWLAVRPPARRDAAGPSTSRLQQALQAVRASTANGRPAERRKALGWLGRELRAVERPSEANEARRLAWSADAPTPRSASDFAAEVETTEGPR
jgi:hypothetical protein